jgi:hypothetical protein
MPVTQPTLDAATQAQWGGSPVGRKPIRLSLSTSSPAQAVALRIRALAGAIASAIAMYLLAIFCKVLRGRF